MSIALWRHQT
ncbi:hypothetical protein AKJ16_DCAP27442 [Drosera capensis]